MKMNIKNIWRLLLIPLMMLPFTGCSDDDDNSGVTGSSITISDQYLNIDMDATETFASFSFTTNTIWKATAEAEGNWFTLLTTSGTGGANQTIRFEFTKNTTKEARTAKITITCGSDTKVVTFTQAGTDREMMTEADVPNFDKFYYPGDPSYTKSLESMFYSDSNYGFYHYKQSEHFFVFWDKQFGDDPNGADVPDWAKVDVDDLLAKAEGFYKTNIDILKMAETGQGKSYLDQYKMQIWLIYSDGWVATGSGYGDTIGALWVTPSTCKPVGSTIAHEIGHSFQYQVYADKLLNGSPNDYTTGFRYGWGGNGGCGYWEQCAQWQSFQSYPAEMFGQDFNPWLVNYHRHFNHEWMRYQSYWLQYYWVMKQGIEAFSAIWKESYSPEDPIMTYMRLYLNNDTQAFWDEYYDYASRMVTYDIDNVREYRDSYWGPSTRYSTSLFEIGDKEYQVAYSNCPETAGFNIIRLNTPKNGGTVSIDFSSLPVGSALAANDAGEYKKGDNEGIGGTVSKYNSNMTNSSDPDFRYGFVAIVNDKPVYSDMTHAASGVASMDVPADATDLYFVVVPTPAKYTSHAWDVDDTTDEQWPYTFKISGTNVFGHLDIDMDADPQSITFEYTVNCDASSTAYELGTIDLNATGDIAELAQAFVMQPSEIGANTSSISNGTTGVPGEGKVVLGLLQPDGTIAYNYTANVGFWIVDGSVGNWGGGQEALYVEYDKDNLIFTYGHYPEEATKAGKLYTVKPCLVYTKGGVQYTATFIINLQF